MTKATKLFGHRGSLAPSGGRAARQVAGHVWVLDKHLFQFGNDMLAVRIAFERVDVRLHLLDHQLLLRRLGHVQHFLHHIVCVLVLIPGQNP